MSLAEKASIVILNNIELTAPANTAINETGPPAPRLLNSETARTTKVATSLVHAGVPIRKRSFGWSAPEK
jgi:hypothetical protein